MPYTLRKCLIGYRDGNFGLDMKEEELARLDVMFLFTTVLY